ncbi:MAG: hypothetical protein AB8E82_16155 [Aureispira sp.]
MNKEKDAAKVARFEGLPKEYDSFEKRKEALLDFSETQINRVYAIHK